MELLKENWFVIIIIIARACVHWKVGMASAIDALLKPLVFVHTKIKSKAMLVVL